MASGEIVTSDEASPVQVQALIRKTPDGPVRSWIARGDLTDSRVSFVVTSPMEHREGDPARAEARLVPTDAWAETAGVSRDGRTLLLVGVDGRQPGWSIGATLPELAQLMLDAGAWNAVNLDGGGSSAVWRR